MGSGKDIVVPPGSVVVRVGAEKLPCPNGMVHPVVPTVEVIYAPGEVEKPHQPVRVTWHDNEASLTPSTSTKPDYIRVSYGEKPHDLPYPDGFIYRCPPGDRKMFMPLYKEWGMFLLLVREQGKEPENYTIHENGRMFPGSFLLSLEKYVQKWDAETMRAALVEAWDHAEKLATQATGVLTSTDPTIRKRIARIPNVLEHIGGGVLPWNPKELDNWGKVTKDVHKWNVSQYLMVLENFQHALNNSKLSESGRREMRQMIAFLRRANIVEMSAESYAELHLEVDRYTTEEVCQLEFHHPESESKPPEGEPALLAKRLPEATEQLPYPDKWPFDVCWFATSGLQVSVLQKTLRGLDPNEPALLVGILASDTGEHHEVFLLGDLRGRAIRPRSYQLVTHRVKYDPDIEGSGQWLRPTCLAPWILHRIVDCINDHKTVVMGKQHLSMASRRDIKRTQKKLKMRKPTPPPWYVVHLRDKVIHETEPRYRADRITRKLSCRFTVRGHDCYKVYRGKLPMDPEFELKLENRGGYKFYKNRPLDEWAREVFRDRKLTPKLDDEWVAIKAWRREKFIKGPEDAPFVPSTRRATKGALAWKR